MLQTIPTAAIQAIWNSLALAPVDQISLTSHHDVNLRQTLFFEWQPTLLRDCLHYRAGILPASLTPWFWTRSESWRGKSLSRNLSIGKTATQEQSRASQASVLVPPTSPNVPNAPVAAPGQKVITVPDGRHYFVFNMAAAVGRYG
jgi:hypothetical protein